MQLAVQTGASEQLGSVGVYTPSTRTLEQDGPDLAGWHANFNHLSELNFNVFLN